jgi:cysteine synthase A
MKANRKMYIENVLDLIGNTPLIKLKNEHIYGKAEFLNPGGSIKDRIALKMINAAEEEGVLKPGMKIIEPTSGNTGIGITLVGRAKGYEVEIIMPKGMSRERRDIIKALGGRLVLTPEELNIEGAVTRAKEMAGEGNCFMPNQFTNGNNVLAHYEETGPELWKQMAGKIDVFIAGVGSGGTVQGVGLYLKEQNPSIKIVVVEPENRSAILGHEPGLHQIQGIGDGFIPEILDISLIDDVIEVSDEQAIYTTQALAAENSILAGISTGALVYGARRMLMKHSGLRIATIFVDRAERYFSTNLFSKEYAMHILHKKLYEVSIN